MHEAQNYSSWLLSKLRYSIFSDILFCGHSSFERILKVTENYRLQSKLFTCDWFFSNKNTSTTQLNMIICRKSMHLSAKLLIWSGNWIGYWCFMQMILCSVPLFLSRWPLNNIIIINMNNGSHPLHIAHPMFWAHNLIYALTVSLLVCFGFVINDFAPPP